MNTKSSAIPRFIDELNVEGGLSGTDLANIADVSKATVSRWKSGRSRRLNSFCQISIMSLAR